MKYCSNFTFFNDNQHSFISKLSTTISIEHVFQFVDTGKYSDGVLCDLSWKFGCVDHNEFLNRLYDYGIGSVVLDWVRSFFSGRFHFFSIDTDSSHFRPDVHLVSLGMPQSSVLRPIFVLLVVSHSCSKFTR